MTDSIVTILQEGVVSIAETRSELVSELQETLEIHFIEHVEAGQQGPPGPPGPGGASAFDAIAGTPLSAHRVVRFENDQAFYCDGDDPAHVGSAIGITVAAAIAGQSIRVQSLGGPVQDAVWNWPIGPLYVGANGALSVTPGAAFVQEVARVQAPTKIMVGLRMAIARN